MRSHPKAMVVDMNARESITRMAEQMAARRNYEVIGPEISNPNFY